MKKRLLFLLIVLFTGGVIFAQVSGTYTVPGGTYSTVISTASVSGIDQIFAPLVVPTVVTGAATAVTATTATLNGTVNANNLSTSVFFDYGLTVAYGTTVNGVPATVNGSSVTACNAPISGLLPGTLYDFRIRATNASGTSNGLNNTFTTPALAPAAVTQAATNVLATTATLNGTINANGASTTVSFDYGLTVAYGTNVPGVPVTVTGNTVTACLANITSLLPGNTYHFRIKGVNSMGTTNGGDMTLATPALAPTVTTVAATAVTGSGATVNGTVTANGAATTVTFDYGLTVAYGSTVNAVPNIVNGNTATSVSAVLSALNTNTTYHYRVKGVNAQGTTNGSDMTFYTDCMPYQAGTVTGPVQVCQGGSGYVYTVPVITNATGYFWTLPTGGSITSGGNTNSIIAAYNATASSGVVYVYGTSACGNGGPSPNVSVTVNTPATPTITGPASVCVNSTGNVYTTQAGMTTYVWTVSAGGLVTGGGTATSSTVTVTWQTAGAKTVKVNYNNAAGCPALTPFTYNVTVNALPTPTISGPNPVCTGISNNIYPTQTGMTGYVWTVTNGIINGGQGTDNINVTWNVAGTQAVTVNYINAAGCTAAAPTSWPVTVVAGPNPTITGTTTLCVNSGYYNYTTQANMTGYNWYVSPGGTINYGLGTNTIQVSWTASGSQIVQVNYTNAANCSAPTPTVLPINVNPLPDPSTSVQGPSTVCGGATGVGYAVPAIGYALNYVWNLPPGATITSGANTNSIHVNFAPNASSGNITVSGNNLCGNGQPSPSFPVTVNQIPPAGGYITGPLSVCQGSSGLMYTVASIPFATGYTWSLPAGATIIGGQNTNTITVSFNNTAVSGNISVFGTNSCGNGTPSPNFALSVNAIPPTPVITMNGTTLSSDALSGNQWYQDGMMISGATSQTYNLTQTGTYWDIVTLNGCASDTSNNIYYTVGINTLQSARFQLYPVPNDGKFTISIISPSAQTFSVSVYNIIGNKIYEQNDLDVNGTLQKDIDLRPVPDGVYTIIFKNSLNQIVRKIIVNK